MYGQQEIDDAVAAGVISAEAANALRTYVEKQRSTQIADEEQFRLITGFNDIFVSIAAAILLFAMGWIGQWIGQKIGLVVGVDGPSPLAALAVAGTAWPLATFFTAKRRMALPSILLLLAFVLGTFAAVASALASATGPDSLNNNLTTGVVVAVSAAVSACAAWLHWRTFRVPITIAAGAGSISAIAVGLVMALLSPDAQQAKTIILAFVLLLGIGMFLFAMWWDSSDRARLTRRSDVAFWLHLLAAPMIVHPIFTLLGLTSGHVTVAEGLAVVFLYLLLGLTAVAVDRRALLVSALAYVLYALDELFRQFGAVELNVALTALVIGSALLLLSAFWHQARTAIVEPLPEGVRDRLPLLERSTAPVSQPAA